MTTRAFALSTILAALIAASPAAAQHGGHDHGAQGDPSPAEPGAGYGGAGSASGAGGHGMMGHGMMGGRRSGGGMMGGGMMGGGMMGGGMMGGGMAGHGGGAMGGPPSWFGTRVTPVMNLSVDDVRGYLDLQVRRLGNKRLKVGEVKTAEDGFITADVVTIDNSLVQRLKVDRRTGAIEYLE